MVTDDDAEADFELLRSSTGKILPCVHNAFTLFKRADQFADVHFDTFLHRMRVGPRDWIDADGLDALRWIQVTFRVASFTLAHVTSAMLSLAYTRKHDSLVEFVDALPLWDNIPRIDQAFSDAWGADDTELHRQASRNFFIALIARARHPGAQVDTLWVFEGPQGSFKSRALRALGGPLHAEISAAIGTTDFQRELRGIWIAELSELESLRGKEASTIKRLLSTPADRFVEKYAVHAESYPRRAVCGQ